MRSKLNCLTGPAVCQSIISHQTRLKTYNIFKCQHKFAFKFSYSFFFFLYRYGIVLKKLDLLKEGLEMLVEAVNYEPLHWGAWLELAVLIPDKETVSIS